MIANRQVCSVLQLSNGIYVYVSRNILRKLMMKT